MKKELTNNLTRRDLPNFSEEIEQSIKNNKLRLNKYHEKDIAYALPLLTKEECGRVFNLLSAKKIAGVFEYAENNELYFGILKKGRQVDVISAMEMNEAEQLLKRLKKEERESILKLLPEDIKQQIGLIGSFNEEKIGNRMSTNFVAVAKNASIKEAMSELVKQAAENDNILMLYVVDKEKKFCGAIDLKDLIVARQGTPLADITTYPYPYLYANTPIEDCVAYITDYAEASIPILDEDNKLLGVVTAQDFVEILDDELGDDYAKLAGLSSEEDLSEPIIRSVKKRIPWLCILLLLGMGVSAVVGLFEEIVAQLPIILCFQSLILDMAGNVGTQSLAVAIRVLMDTRIGKKHKAVLVLKELRIGLLNGGILGVLSFVAVGVYLYLMGNSLMFSFAISGCLGLAMATAMTVSALSGALIPLLFKRIGIDPAVASGPLITTVNDLVAVVTYYGLAWFILLNTMHLA